MLETDEWQAAEEDAGLLDSEVEVEAELEEETIESKTEGEEE